MFDLRPRPIDDRIFWDRVRDEPTFAPWRSAVTAAADRASALPEMPTATHFLAARRHNDRSQVDRFWQLARGGLGALAARRAMLGFTPPAAGEASFDGQDDQLLDWLWAHLTQPTWAVVAHLPEKDVPDLAGPPTLDLAETEMALAMAELAEILGPWMEAITPRLLRSVRHEVLRRVIRPFADPEAGFHRQGWADPAGAMNNWTGVCAGSILGACQSLLAQGVDDPALGPARDRAIELLNLYLAKAFTSEGECDEGLGYWAYGIGVACRGWMRLSGEEFRRQVHLDRLAQVADYPRKAHLFGETFYGRGDASGRRPALDWVWWLAQATGNEWLADWTRRDGYVSVVKGFVPWEALRALEQTAGASTDAPGAVVEADAVTQPGEPAGRRRWLPDQQVAVFETRAAERSLVVSLAGGHNAMSHNHNDLGDVNLWVDQQPVLIDLGAPRYTADFFSGRRYEYTTASSRGHNVPLIAETPQREGREARARVVDLGHRAFAVDATAAYPPEAGLVEWTRRLDVADGKAADSPPLTLHDRIELRDVGPVALRFWTWSEPRVDGDRVTVGPVRLSFSAAPEEITVERYTAEQLHLRHQGTPEAEVFCLHAAFAPAPTHEIDTRIEPA